MVTRRSPFTSSRAKPRNPRFAFPLTNPPSATRLLSHRRKSSPEATTYNHRGTRHERCVIGSKENSDTRHLIRPPNPPQSMELTRRRAGLGRIRLQLKI